MICQVAASPLLLLEGVSGWRGACKHNPLSSSSERRCFPSPSRPDVPLREQVRERPTKRLLRNSNYDHSLPRDKYIR